ncbi:MAG: NAD(P)H-binding protein [Thaumarchaeota archaeon]|nr:NAD(P)H-binding protein [Nitrososphaerota archaeon]
MISNNNAKIIVAGANGYLGTNLRKSLHRKKFNFVSISRKDFEAYVEEDKILVNNIDVSISNRIKNYDVLINLIGSGRKTIYEDYYSTNTNLTKTIVEICKNANIQKIIHISGLGVSKYNTLSYFISKHRAEDEIIKSGLDYVIFRPSYIIGNQDPLSKKIMKNALKYNQIFVPGSGNYVIQPIFINDVIEIMINAISNSLFTNNIFDLVGPEVISFKKFVEIFKQAKKLEQQTQFIDMEQSYFQAIRGYSNVYCVDDLNILVGSFTGNPNRITKITGIKLKNIQSALNFNGSS